MNYGCQLSISSDNGVHRLSSTDVIIHVLLCKQIKIIHLKLSEIARDHEGSSAQHLRPHALSFTIKIITFYTFSKYTAKSTSKWLIRNF